jgi:hypothetical protein
VDAAAGSVVATTPAVFVVPMQLRLTYPEAQAPVEGPMERTASAAATGLHDSGAGVVRARQQLTSSEAESGARGTVAAAAPTGVHDGGSGVVQAQATVTAREAGAAVVAAPSLHDSGASMLQVQSSETAAVMESAVAAAALCPAQSDAHESSGNVTDRQR